MADDLQFKVRGLDELRAALKALPDKLRRRYLRGGLAAGGRIFRDEAKRLTPVISVATKRRNVGTVRDAISVRTSKAASRAGDVGVFVNVRPAKGAKYGTSSAMVAGKQVRVRKLKSASVRGANSPKDPFYWRWLEFGKQGYAGRHMLTRAAGKTQEALAAVERTWKRAMARLNEDRS